MQIHYWQSVHGNFGDDLNLWLWDELLPGISNVHDDILLVGVGTVLSKRLPTDIKKLVIGSGAGYGNIPDLSETSMWDIRAVRGKKTAKLLGLDEKLGVTDPAVLIADLPEFQDIPKTYEISFLPHWESHVFGNWAYVSQQAGIHYINPCDDSKHVIREIAKSHLIIAESMHAAILADAFRIPWIPVKTSNEINQFKWEDWVDGLGVVYEPLKIELSTLMEARYKKEAFRGIRIKPLNRSIYETNPTPLKQTALRKRLRNMFSTPAITSLMEARKATPQLSNESALQEKKTKLKNILNTVAKDYL